MRVQVEKCFTLVADKVVRGGGATTGYPDGLGISEGMFQCFVIDGSYAIGSEAGAKENEGWLDSASGGRRGSDGPEAIFVDVGGVFGHVNAEAGGAVGL